MQHQIIITLKICYHDHDLSLKLAHPLNLAKYNDKKLWDRTSTSVQVRVQHQIIITLKICYHDHDQSLKLAHPLNLEKYNDKKLWDRTSTSVQGRVQHQIIIMLKICYHDHELSLKSNSETRLKYFRMLGVLASRLRVDFEYGYSQVIYNTTNIKRVDHGSSSAQKFKVRGHIKSSDIK